MKRRITVSGLCALGSFAALAVSSAALGDFIFYTDPGAFQAAIDDQGKVSKGFWDFNPNNVGDEFLAGIDDPLNFITAPATGIWDEMPIDNVQFQSNVDPQGGDGPNPHGDDGLAFATPFADLFPHNVLVANFKGDSFDILSGVPVGDNHTAMAMNVVVPEGAGGDVFVTVWDKNEQHKTQWILPGPWQSDETRFIGILALDSRTIGRVNIWDDNHGFEGISAIEVFVPSPGALALLALGAVGVRRKRKRAA